MKRRGARRLISLVQLANLQTENDVSVHCTTRIYKRKKGQTYKVAGIVASPGSLRRGLVAWSHVARGCQ